MGTCGTGERYQPFDEKEETEELRLVLHPINSRHPVSWTATAPEVVPWSEMKSEKAYKNLRFLTSPEARTIRMLCEYEEPHQRFCARGIDQTIVFFGSARVISRKDAEGRVHDATTVLEKASSSDQAAAASALEWAQKRLLMSRFYEDAYALSRMLTRWSRERREKPEYVVCTGGGPGIMEAANRGASEVEGGKSVGLCISLPFEEQANPYITEGLSFEFHYFFMRKLWFVYPARALIIFPGGFGTLDEFFETVTLRQTCKLEHPVPVVLYGTEYWKEVLGFDAMVKWGTISPQDVELLHFTDDPEDAFDYVTRSLEEIEAGKWEQPDTMAK